jgi:hypothetical protein
VHQTWHSFSLWKQLGCLQVLLQCSDCLIVRLRDSNVIRWRYATAPDGSYLRNEAGQLVKESNARVIRWSDGSETLQLGGEMLALSKQNIQGDNAYLYAVHYDIIQVGAWVNV